MESDVKRLISFFFKFGKNSLSFGTIWSLFLDLLIMRVILVIYNLLGWIIEGRAKLFLYYAFFMPAHSHSLSVASCFGVATFSWCFFIAWFQPIGKHNKVMVSGSMIWLCGGIPEGKWHTPIVLTQAARLSLPVLLYCAADFIIHYIIFPRAMRSKGLCNFYLSHPHSHHPVRLSIHLLQMKTFDREPISHVVLLVECHVARCVYVYF